MFSTRDSVRINPTRSVFPTYKVLSGLKIWCPSHSSPRVMRIRIMQHLSMDSPISPLAQLHPVQWTANTAWSTIEDMCVNHSGANILVAKEFLDCPDIITVLDEVSRERVTKGVTTRALC